jgi:hypothetical protein
VLLLFFLLWLVWLVNRRKVLVGSLLFINTVRKQTHKKQNEEEEKKKNLEVVQNKPSVT